MLSDLKDTLKHSAIYGLGAVSTTLVGFILLPFYTKEIPVSEYGVLGVLETVIKLSIAMLSLGIHPTLFRWFNIYDDPKKRGAIIFSVFTGYCINPFINSYSCNIGRWFNTQMSNT